MQAALEALTPLIQQELHRLAARYMAGERPGHILQATALVNEAYMRLVDWKDVRWQNRAHFFGMAAQIMRRVLVDVARTRGRAKRGGGAAARLAVGSRTRARRGDSVDLVALDDALKAPGGAGRAAEPRRRAALLRRTEPRGGGARARRVGRHRAARLEPRARLAVSGAERRGMTAEQYPRSRAAVSRRARSAAGATGRRFSTAPAAATTTCAVKWSRCCARTTRPATSSPRRRSTSPHDWIAPETDAEARTLTRHASAPTTCCR